MMRIRLSLDVLANGVGSELEQRWSLSDDKPLQQNYARVATNTHFLGPQIFSKSLIRNSDSEDICGF